MGSKRFPIAVAVAFLAFVFLISASSGAVRADGPHAVFNIDGNDALRTTAATELWPGDGSAETPFIVQGYIINAGGASYCFQLANTDLHVIILNKNYSMAETLLF